jgi:hypothetical protein
MKRALGSIPGVIVSITILALGLSVFMYARVGTPKLNDMSNRTVQEPLEIATLKDLQQKAVRLRQDQPRRTEPSISTSFIGVGVDVYRSIVSAQNGRALEETTALQRARIFDNDVHRRFLRLESLPGRTIAAADWVREMQKPALADEIDAPHFTPKKWAKLLKSGEIKGSTWAVICLWIRSEIDRDVPNLKLEVDRMALRNRWFPYDMTDLEGIKDVVGVEPPTQSLVNLGPLAGQTSILFPLYIEELLEVPSKERHDKESKSYSVGEAVYFPRILSWDEPDTQTTKTNSSLLTDPLYISPPSQE